MIVVVKRVKKWYGVDTKFFSMVLQRYVLLGVIATLFSWGAWVLTLFSVDPNTSGSLGLSSFLVTLFVAVLGTVTVLGILFRRAVSKNNVAYNVLGVSVRQGFFLSLILVGSLFLKTTEIFTWWSVLLLFGGLILLEYFFHSKHA